MWDELGGSDGEYGVLNEVVCRLWSVARVADGLAVLDVVEDDEGGAPLPIRYATQFGPRRENIDLNAVDVDSLLGPVAARRDLAGEGSAKAFVVLELGFDVAQALMGLLHRGRENDNVSFLLVERGVDGIDQGFERGFGGSARGSNRETARGAGFESL